MDTTKIFVLCLAIFGVVFGLGVIASGGVMCWQSTKHNTCSDWEYKSGHITDECGYTWEDIIAASKCDTKCYCRSIGYDYDCLVNTPGGVSPTFIAWGVVLIIFGIVIVVGSIIGIICLAQD